MLFSQQTEKCTALVLVGASINDLASRVTSGNLGFWALLP